MSSDLQALKDLRISFVDIKSATNSFADSNFLGEGGFGPVYKGLLSLSTCSSEPDTPVAVKRLDKKHGQGEKEFLKEISMLTTYKHDNLVSLLRFCDDGDEKILVYKREVNGSLDKHLISIDLTWERRLRICLGAARGLQHLHEGVGKEIRVFHRDIKSSNILLDEKWEAKISDFGLSIIAPTNQIITFVATSPCGTVGYVDPQYVSTHTVSKESDVFSFGVVLFEVLCGKLACNKEYKDPPSSLVKLVKHHYKKRELDKIIMPCLLDQMKPYSLKVFSKIAFKCLNDDRRSRPSMGSIVKELEIALGHQLGTQTTESNPQTGTQTIESNPQTGTQTELWGSQTGGKPFLFKLKSNQKLRKISIFEITFHIDHSREEVLGIHSLIFTVEDSDGSSRSQQYGGRVTDSRGDKITINFDTEEELVGLSGTIGAALGLQLITSLSFVTNTNKYGPFGVERDSRFSKSWEVGLFDGFYGRCDWYIDAIGCLLKATN